MSKKVSIVSSVVAIIALLGLLCAIVMGVFTIVKHTDTIIDKTNQTLQVVISDGVNEHPAYNSDLGEIVLPYIPKQNFNLPKMNSEFGTYFTFKVWGGTKIEDKTYGFIGVSDYSYTGRVSGDELAGDGIDYLSRKWMALQQTEDVIALTNVHQMTGAMITPVSEWLTYTRASVYSSTGNLADFNKFSKRSYFQIGKNWYMLEWKHNLQYVAVHHFKALCLKYLDELGKNINKNKGINVSLLMNEFCDVYNVNIVNGRGKNIKVVLGNKIDANIIAPATFVYMVGDCTDNFVLTQKLDIVDF